MLGLVRIQYQEKALDINAKIADYKLQLKEIEDILNRQKIFEEKLNSISKVIKANMEIEEFDKDVFEALFKNVIVGGMDGEEKNSHMLTFVFSEDRTNPGTAKMKYLVFDRFDMPVDFYEFYKNEYGVNKRRYIKSIPIRLAIETQE